MGIGKERRTRRPTRGHHPERLAPLEAQHPLEHMRQVRGAHMDPDSYTNRLPRAVKAKSERAPAGGEKTCFERTTRIGQKDNNLGNLTIFSD